MGRSEMNSIKENVVLRPSTILNKGSFHEIMISREKARVHEFLSSGTIACATSKNSLFDDL